MAFTSIIPERDKRSTAAEKKEEGPVTDEYIGGRTLRQWQETFPLLTDIMARKEVFWTNPRYKEKPAAETVSAADIEAAEKRLERFAAYIETAFPETKRTKGIIESPVVEISGMKQYLQQTYGHDIPGRLLVKCDSDLPISGSIKARGGIYEVLATAESIAFENGILKPADDYAKIAGDEFKCLFSQYSIAVGSTGNLGLSIGIMAAKLGFKTTVYMSRDAKQWKKDLLRQKGAVVKEVAADYSQAVEEGRNQADADPRCHFIDDENSKELFLGYAVAAGRLKRQLEDMQVPVDSEHPLIVYLPCGVGGGPGGVTFGLKKVFGENVHAFFVEPTHSPCFLLGLLTGLHDKVSVKDFHLDNRTAADGLAVGRASAFVGRTVGGMVSGCLTIADERLFSLLKAFVDREAIYLEPSAAAGAIGPVKLFQEDAGQVYMKDNQLNRYMDDSTHIVWATGGGMVPKNVLNGYYAEASGKSN